MHMCLCRLAFVTAACKPPTVNDNTPKTAGFRVKELSWVTTRPDGQWCTAEGIVTELRMTHSEGEERVVPADRRLPALVTRKMIVSSALKWISQTLRESSFLATHLDACV